MAGTLRATIFTAVKGDAAEKLAKQLDGLSGKMTSFGNMASKAVKGIASLGAALVSSKFIGDSVEQAKNLERSILALDSVFGATAPRMVEFSKNAVSMGLSQSEAAKASTFLGSVLQQYGFDADSAAVETEKLTKLSADLAATYGYDVQEALLAVTALFRGEYDPIEKFGVAMKQNEINAIRNARGLGELTGAAEMQADAQIRLELLMERSTAAQGAMERGAGTLYVETEKLRATFENLQANLGQELIPVFADLFEQLRPIIEDAAPALVEIFQFVGEVIKELAGIFTDLFDPTTVIGESVMALGNAFDSLFETIFGRDFNIAAVFDGVRAAIDLVLRALNDIVLIIENIIIGAQAIGQWFGALLSGDWATVAKGVDGVARELYATRDAALAAANAMDVLYYKARESLRPENLGDQTEIWDKLAERATTTGTTAGQQFSQSFGKGAATKAKDAVADFWSNLTDEVAKQSARIRLEGMGASEGLISAILGSGEDWKKVFNAVLKDGAKSLEKAQSLFNKTADGLKDIEKQAEKLRQAEIDRAKQMARAEPDMKSYWEAYIGYLQEGIDKQQALAMAQADFDNAMAEMAAQRAAENRRLREEFRKSVQEAFAAFDATGAVEQMGEFESAAKDLREELTNLVEEGLKKDGIGLFSRGQQKQLNQIINQIGDSLEQIGNARDKIVSEIEAAQESLAQQQQSKKSLFQSIVDSLFGNVNIAQIGGKSTTIIKSLKRTLEQTTQFSKQLGDLRELGLSEQLIQQIIGQGAQIGGQTAKALVQGGPKAIEEINRLYDEIGNVAEQIGSDAADAMFDAGIDTTNSLIDGLLSQQEQLAMVAEQLADVFETAFSTRFNRRTLPLFFENIQNILNGLGDAPATTAAAASINSASVGRAGSPVYNISINPGLVSDPAALGREVVTAIQRYESTSGRVFARA